MTTENLLTNEIPDKFKDPETGAVRVDALAKSYRELEKKLSSTPGAPATPDDYCINCDHGMFTMDKDVNAKLHAMGLNNAQAQAVYDLAAERLIPVIASLAAEYQADREVEKLVSHFGGVDQWKEISRQLLSFGQKNLPADVLHSLSGSFEGVMALYRMMKTEEPGLKTAADKPSNTGEKEIQSMMRDPKYWRDRDPAFVAKVTEGFKKMYGGQ
jgi:hypothetical protein